MYTEEVIFNRDQKSSYKIPDFSGDLRSAFGLYGHKIAHGLEHFGINGWIAQIIGHSIEIPLQIISLLAKGHNH